ncbi:MAG: CAP domain-containing protein [Leptolyngbyaceae bacterium]|nr:CAP domain-containing protein [Leptolyngbyaceae bacterium]
MDQPLTSRLPVSLIACRFIRASSLWLLLYEYLGADASKIYGIIREFKFPVFLLDTFTEVIRKLESNDEVIRFKPKDFSTMLPDTVGDTFRDAKKITLKSQKRAIRNHIGGTDTNDYFKFRLSRSSNVKLALKQRADANFELLNRRGNIVASSTQRGNRQKTIQLDDLDKGKYFIRVYQTQGKTRYKLQFSCKSADPTPSSSNHPFVQRVLDLTNAERAKAGLSPLRLDSKLTNVAHAHSRSMAVDDFFSHTGSDGSTPFERIEEGGYRYRSAAENIAAGYSTPESVVTAWMNSAGHRANILNANLQEIGIGYYFAANDVGSVRYNSYWTQAFGTPFR